MKTQKIDNQVHLILENQNEIDSIAALLRSERVVNTIGLGAHNDIERDSYGLRWHCSPQVHVKYNNIRELIGLPSDPNVYNKSITKP